jgi:hypothetical protein
MTNLLYTQTIDRQTLNLNTIKSLQLYLSSMTYMNFIMLLEIKIIVSPIMFTIYRQ